MNLTRTFKSVVAAGIGAGVAHVFLSSRVRREPRHEIPVFVPAEPVAVEPLVREPVAETIADLLEKQDGPKPVTYKPLVTPKRQRATHRAISGERHYASALTDGQAKEIFHARNCEGADILDLAVKYGVGYHVVNAITSGSTYTWVTSKVRCAHPPVATKLPPRKVMTRELASEIKALHDQGVETDYNRLAQAFGFGPDTVQKVCKGRHAMSARS